MTTIMPRAVLGKRSANIVGFQIHESPAVPPGKVLRDGNMLLVNDTRAFAWTMLLADVRQQAREIVREGMKDYDPTRGER